MNTARRTFVAVVEEVFVAIGATAVWLVQHVTMRRIGVGLIVALVLVVTTLTAIWLTAAVLGYFLPPSGCAWLFDIGSCS